MRKLYVTFRAWLWGLLIWTMTTREIEDWIDYNRDPRGYWLARLPWYAYWAYRIEIIDKEIDAHELYNDPMNGCPEDFAYDDNRTLQGMEERYEAIRYRVPYMVRMVLDFYLEAYTETAWAESQENCPWA